MAAGASRRIGVRSPPPPNQPCVVISMRVLKCAAGTSGLCMCATRLMPQAQKRGSSAAPGICARNSGLNVPQTVETFTPTFSNTRPRMTRISPPPPSLPSSVGRCQARRSKRPGGGRRGGRPARPRSPRRRRRAGRAAPRTTPRAVSRRAACGGGGVTARLRSSARRGGGARRPRGRCAGRPPAAPARPPRRSGARRAVHSRAAPARPTGRCPSPSARCG